MFGHRNKSSGERDPILAAWKAQGEAEAAADVPATAFTDELDRGLVPRPPLFALTYAKLPYDEIPDEWLTHTVKTLRSWAFDCTPIVQQMHDMLHPLADQKPTSRAELEHLHATFTMTLLATLHSHAHQLMVAEPEFRAYCEQQAALDRERRLREGKTLNVLDGDIGGGGRRTYAVPKSISRSPAGSSSSAGGAP